MTWTRLSDDFTDRPQLLKVSRSARHLLTELYVYANRHLLDGLIPAAALPRLTDSSDIEADLAELAEADLVEQEGATWRLDWSQQESREEVLARRQHQAEKQKRYRDRRARHERGDHSACDPRYCRSVTGNETSNETGRVTPSRPDPTRPVPKGQGQGETPDAGSPGGSPAPAEMRELPLPAHRHTGDCCQLPDVHPVHGVHREAS